MNGLPVWLPPMTEVNPWTSTSFDELYAIFEHDFVLSRANYTGHPVWFFPEMEDGKLAIFWHLTSRKDDTGVRLPDLRRSARLCWGRPMLDNADDAAILAWDYEEANLSIKTYVWLREHDFVVIMKKMKNQTRRLVTSFWIEYSNTRRKMMKKYHDRMP